MEKNTRIPLFLSICIPLRILIASAPQLINTKYLQYYSIVLFGLGLSFMILYFTNMRLDAPESGGKTWWADFRPIHGMLYLCAAIYAFKENKLATIPLAIDVIFGLILFTYFEFYKID